MHIFFTIILIYLHSLLWTVHFTMALYICYGTGNYEWNNYLVDIFISDFNGFTYSAIMYASGQSTDNSDDSSTGGSTTDNSGSSTTTTDNSGSSTTTTDNSGSSTTH